MYVVFVTVKVKPGFEQQFVDATLPNHRGTIEEPGALRFDVLRDASDPSTFYLYEVYRDEAAAAAHKDTAHYQAWRDTVAGWMAEPRGAAKAFSIAPEAEDGW